MFKPKYAYYHRQNKNLLLLNLKDFNFAALTTTAAAGRELLSISTSTWEIFWCFDWKILSFIIQDAPFNRITFASRVSLVYKV